MFNFIKSKIAQKIISDYNLINGWLSENEAIGLYSIANKLKGDAIVVEIGSWQGKSTFCIAKGLRSGKVFAIDPFNADGGNDTDSQIDYIKEMKNDSLLKLFENNMNRFKLLSKVVVKKGYSYDFHQDFESIDFLFIDGDHSIEGCKLDFNLYANKIKKGGFIGFHDFYPDRPELGPTYVIQEIISASDDFVFYRQYDSLWIGRKIK